jgi:hypothetical protein
MATLFTCTNSGICSAKLCIVVFRESYGLKETGLLTYSYPKDKSKLMMSKVGRTVVLVPDITLHIVLVRVHSPNMICSSTRNFGPSTVL